MLGRFEYVLYLLTVCLWLSVLVTAVERHVNSTDFVIKPNFGYSQAEPGRARAGKDLTSIKTKWTPLTSTSYSSLVSNTADYSSKPHIDLAATNYRRRSRQIENAFTQKKSTLTRRYLKQKVHPKTVIESYKTIRILFKPLLFPDNRYLDQGACSSIANRLNISPCNVFDDRGVRRKPASLGRRREIYPHKFTQGNVTSESYQQLVCLITKLSLLLCRAFETSSNDATGTIFNNKRDDATSEVNRAKENKNTRVSSRNSLPNVSGITKDGADVLELFGREPDSNVAQAMAAVTFGRRGDPSSAAEAASSLRDYLELMLRVMLNFVIKNGSPFLQRAVSERLGHGPEFQLENLDLEELLNLSEFLTRASIELELEMKRSRIERMPLSYGRR
ncbi:hypothetical protein ElyMa_000333600 [Elysia marginata]|uniref:Uncharacterized protein n=1 Tax=Elysia marginata TaxID=1093978 RepID=A0AAV4FE55_9GAST|nr:hypothetical protein ElyMa_000333600 [Elysia marginata]